MFQNCNTLLTSLNVRISRGLEQFHRVDLAESALVTRIRKDDWSRADLFHSHQSRGANRACIDVDLWISSADCYSFVITEILRADPFFVTCKYHSQEIRWLIVDFDSHVPSILEIPTKVFPCLRACAMQMHWMVHGDLFSSIGTQFGLPISWLP